MFVPLYIYIYIYISFSPRPCSMYSGLYIVKHELGGGLSGAAKTQIEQNSSKALKFMSILGVSENRGPEYSTLNSRILVIRIPR